MDNLDFEKIGWHDCPVYSMKFDDNLEFDLDFILEWSPQEGGEYMFLVAPALLTFKEVENFSMEVEASFLNGFEIVEVIRSENNWEIKLVEGVITFSSSDFTQVLRKKPILTRNQFLSESEREV